MPKTNCPKYISDPHSETRKGIATKREEIHIWDRALPSKSHVNRPDICPWEKSLFFLIMDFPGGLLSHAIHF